MSKNATFLTYYLPDIQSVRNSETLVINNLEIIYPHAISMTKNILYPILNETEAQNIVCKLLDYINIKQKNILKVIYSQMIYEDKIYFNECISTKLNIDLS